MCHGGKEHSKLENRLITNILLLLAKGSLVRKLSGHGQLSWLAVPPSCQPHHHVSHIIMSTTHHQVAGKCNSSEARQFTGENTRARNPVFFRPGNVAPGVAAVGSRFRGCVARSAKVVDKKCTGLQRELDLLKIGMFGALLEDEGGKMWTRLFKISIN